MQDIHAAATCCTRYSSQRPLARAKSRRDMCAGPREGLARSSLLFFYGLAEGFAVAADTPLKALCGGICGGVAANSPAPARWYTFNRLCHNRLNSARGHALKKIIAQRRRPLTITARQPYPAFFLAAVRISASSTFISTSASLLI